MLTEGLVLRASCGAYTVQAGARILHCTLRGNLRKTIEYTTSTSTARRASRVRPQVFRDAIAVGDRVLVREAARGTGAIEEVLPRSSQYSRAGFRGREQTLICNLDLVVIVFAYAEPAPDLWKLDRFLVTAEAEGLAVLLVANKRDLVVTGAGDPFEEYARLGYNVLRTCASTADGIPQLAEAIHARIAAFVGPSGVGKSSLLNALHPGLNLRTGDVGVVTHKGRHTTTTAQLIPIRGAGWVADTPGLRQFELLNLSAEEIADAFPEFAAYRGRCRFDDCRHHTEPDCAVRQAAEAGEIGARRLRSYLQMAGLAPPDQG